jgi:hypothetical protein
MKSVDWHTSEKIADIVDARIGECVANVTRALLDFRNTLPKDAVYVEGLWMFGGQLYNHTWIETRYTIIDPTLARETNWELRGTAKHYSIDTYSEEELETRFADQPRGPGVRLEMKLNWDDPRVVKLAHEVDPP